MAEAGFGEGGEPLTVEILYNTSEAHQAIAVAIGQMWKQTLGVETTLANQEWQTFLDARWQPGLPAGPCGMVWRLQRSLDLPRHHDVGIGL